MNGSRSCEIKFTMGNIQTKIIADASLGFEEFNKLFEARYRVSLKDVRLTLDEPGEEPATSVAPEQILWRCHQYGDYTYSKPFSSAAWDAASATLSVKVEAAVRSTAAGTIRPAVASRKSKAIEGESDEKRTRNHTPEGAAILAATREHALYAKLTDDPNALIDTPRLVIKTEVEKDTALAALYNKCETAAFATVVNQYPHLARSDFNKLYRRNLTDHNSKQSKFEKVVMAKQADPNEADPVGAAAKEVKRNQKWLTAFLAYKGCLVNGVWEPSARRKAHEAGSTTPEQDALIEGLKGREGTAAKRSPGSTGSGTLKLSGTMQTAAESMHHRHLTSSGSHIDVSGTEAAVAGRGSSTGAAEAVAGSGSGSGAVAAVAAEARDGQTPQPMEMAAADRATSISRRKCADGPPQRRCKAKHNHAAAGAVVATPASPTLGGPSAALEEPAVDTTNPGAVAAGGVSVPQQQLLPCLDGGQDAAAAVGGAAARPQPQGQEVTGATPQGSYTQQQLSMQPSGSVPRIVVRPKQELVTGAPVGPVTAHIDQDNRAVGPSAGQQPTDVVAQPNTTMAQVIGGSGHPDTPPAQHQPSHVAAPIQDPAGANGSCVQLPTVVKPDPDVMNLVSDEEDGAIPCTTHNRHSLQSAAGVMQPFAAAGGASGVVEPGHGMAAAVPGSGSGSGVVAAVAGSGAPLAPLTGRIEQGTEEMYREMMYLAGQQLDSEARGKLRTALFKLQFLDKDEQRIKALYYTVCCAENYEEACSYLLAVEKL